MKSSMLKYALSIFALGSLISLVTFVEAADRQSRSRITERKAPTRAATSSRTGRTTTPVTTARDSESVQELQNTVNGLETYRDKNIYMMLMADSDKCIDSDEMFDSPEHIKGFVYYLKKNGDKLIPQTIKDVCKEEGAKFLLEATCKNYDGGYIALKNPNVFEGHVCAEHEQCKGGACVPKLCNDTDGGIDFEEKGTVTQYNEDGSIKPGFPKTDQCLSETLLSENMCADESGVLQSQPMFVNCCDLNMVCGNDKCEAPTNAADNDNDMMVDQCDICPVDQFNDVDEDGLCANEDNCPFQANADQADFDGDGYGDVCDDFVVLELDTSDVSRSHHPAISGDGRYVAFVGKSFHLKNMFGFDGNIEHTYVRDLKTGDTELVSISSNGDFANEDSRNPSISSDGRYIAYLSRATNLIENDVSVIVNPDYFPTESSDIYVHDRQTGTTEKIVNESGEHFNGAQLHAQLSGNGKYVVFSSSATNIADKPKGTYVWNRDTKKINLIPQSAGSWPKINFNGNSVLYERRIVEPNYNAYQLAVFDRETGLIDVILDDFYIASLHANISPDGNFIAHRTIDDYSINDLVVHDKTNNTSTPASISTSNVLGDASHIAPAIGGLSGNFVLFQSNSTNLIPGLDNTCKYYVRNIQEGTTDAIDGFFCHMGSVDHQKVAISLDERFIAFVAQDGTFFKNVFVKNILTGEIYQVDSFDVGE